MKTQINGKEAYWPPLLWALWHARRRDASAPPGDPWQANYYTPRPARNEYDRGSRAEGFVYTIRHDVIEVHWMDTHDGRACQTGRVVPRTCGDPLEGTEATCARPRGHAGAHRDHGGRRCWS